MRARTWFHAWWFVVAWALGAGLAIRTYLLTSGRPHRHYGNDTPWLVASVAVEMLAESALLAFLWAAWTRTSLRLVLVGGVLLWCFVQVLFAMHASNVFFVHLGWLVLVVLGLLVGVIVSAVRGRST